MTVAKNHPEAPPPAHQPPGVDLTNCDREPIHIPGSIQPHGLILAMAEPDLTIVSVSANVVDWTRRPAPEFGGQPLEALLSDEGAAAVRGALGSSDPVGGNPYALRLRGREAEAEWNSILHRHDGLALLEMEPRDASALSYRACFDHVRALTQRLQTTKTLADACAATVAEVRRMTGYGFVMVYRFLGDASGQVIAEDRADDMPSYIGLHFPASDIPAQARALYVRNPSRNIPDAAYSPAALVPAADPRTERPIDLSQAGLRSVSPIHVEYLSNMGMRASMSVSIIRDGQLWGLISCMDREPRYPSYEVRQACELMAHALAWQIGVLAEVEAANYRLRLKTLQTTLALDMGSAADAHEVLRNHSPALLEAVDASGAVLWAAGTMTPVGRLPPQEDLGGLLTWVQMSMRGEILHTDHLSASYPGGAALVAEASGLLAVPLSRSGQDMMLWFRPELPRTVQWGGDPNKAATPQGADGRLHPRKSFEAWAEQVRGRSRPWEPYEIAAAMEFRDMAVDAIVRRSAELERSSAAIRRVADQLETFVHVASHDLLEPARQVETLTDILQDMIPAEIAADEEVSEVVSGIRGVSGRLRRLIGDLADYSQVGRQAQPFEPVDLDDVLRETREMLARPIAEAEARIVAESLPMVVCDKRQIRHVFLNLISNALKYRSPARRPVIRVFEGSGPAGQPMKPETTKGLDPAGARAVTVCVEDNGIGFPPGQGENIFEPFRRLHGSGRYEGTGVGLAICRKIIERHGGSIHATGREGQGSTFCFALPVRGSYPLNS
ncbi:ATP-binding protein [Roseomonas populi]|uniref:histidine kinase n=1 Tax=Roseomonas populi TaxID=3121582 RepID=A0ABT1X3X1_9PROT|nr:ATP-binding protein [Roseomonas pecuniae]MCR0982796.1 ATP-binding protein [Roseomonas pecuniae]